MIKKYISLAFIVLFPLITHAEDRSQAESLYKQGYQTAVKGDLDGGIKLFQQAIAADDSFFLAYFDLGGAYESKGDKDNALAEYLKTVKIKPDFIEASVEAGTILLIDKKQYDEALASFKQALLTKNPSVDPRFPANKSVDQALQNSAIAYAMKREYGIAHSMAQSYLKNPDIPHKADIQINTLFRRTEQDMNPSRQFTSDLAPIGKLLYGGQAAEALKKYKEFEQKHDLATLSPMDAWDLYSGIAMASAYAKDYLTTETYFTKAVSVAAPLPAKLQIESRFNLACSLSLEGKIDGALQQIEQVLWLDYITKYDSDFAPGSRKTPKLMTDNDLANARKDPRFTELTQKYGL